MNNGPNQNFVMQNAKPRQGKEVKPPHKYDFKIELPVRPTFTILPESFKPNIQIEGEIGKFSRLKQQIEQDTIDKIQ